MPIPGFNRHGFLPPGVHDCSLAEISARFGTNQHRTQLVSRLFEFLSAELRPQFVEPVYVGGSFVTDKEKPDDVDVVLDLRHASECVQVRGLRLMQRRPDFMDRYRVDFWINFPGHNDFTMFFQYPGPKLAYRGLTNKQLKGILRVHDD